MEGPAWYEIPRCHGYYGRNLLPVLNIPGPRNASESAAMLPLESQKNSQSKIHPITLALPKVTRRVRRLASQDPFYGIFHITNPAHIGFTHPKSGELL